MTTAELYAASLHLEGEARASFIARFEFELTEYAKPVPEKESGAWSTEICNKIDDCRERGAVCDLSMLAYQLLGLAVESSNPTVKRGTVIEFGIEDESGEDPLRVSRDGAHQYLDGVLDTLGDHQPGTSETVTFEFMPEGG